MTRADERLGLPSASQLYALRLCPGRHNACQGIPEPPASEDAAFGTRVHAALASPCIEVAGLADEEREMYDACRTVTEKAVAACNPDGLPLEPHYEERLQWLDAKLEVIATGKADLILVGQGVAIVVDYKTGRVAVDPAETNLQLRGLAVMASDSFGAEKVFCVVVQPWVSPQYTIAEYDLHAIAVARDEIEGILEATADPKEPRIPGEHQCKYCRAKDRCPERLGQLDQLAIQALAKPTLMELSGVQVAGLLDRVPTIEALCKDIRANAITRIKEDPVAVPGYTLKDGAVREEITDADTVHSRATSRGVPHPEFMRRCVKVTKTPLKELVRNHCGVKGKGLEAMMVEILAGCVEAKQNAPSLVRVGDGK
jgi:CRISPR/Cas system-associated exonuclease Cas4 (RecB family)